MLHLMFYERLTSPRLKLGASRRGLVNILSYSIQRCSACGCDIVGLVPEKLFPEFFFNLRKILFYKPGTCRLVSIEKSRNIGCGLSPKKDVDMILIVVELNNVNSILRTNSRKIRLQTGTDGGSDDFSPIFDHQNKAIVQVIH